MNGNSLEPASTLNVLYALPIPRFYSQIGGVGGHVAHANGIMKSIAGMGGRLDVLAEEESSDTLNFVNTWSCLPCRNPNILGRYFWGRSFIEKLSEMVSKENYSFCYMRYSSQFAPLIPALKRALGNTPLVLELNSFAAQRGVVSRAFFTTIEKRALSVSDLVICISNPLKNDVDTILGHTTGSGCIVVPNGVDPGRFTPVLEPRENTEKTVKLCYCGVLKKGYGLNHLLATHKELEVRFPNLKLHIIGDGPSREGLESYSGRGRNVIFHGAVGFNEVPAKLVEMDILVYTTSIENSFQSPIKLYEYMCTGRPIVAADTPQIRKTLLGKEPCGLIFDVENSASLYQAIQSLLEKPDLGMSLAEVALDTVEADHHWDHRVAAIRLELETRGILNE